MRICPFLSAISGPVLMVGVLTGCAGSTPTPPSLMRRPIEKLSLEEPPAVPLTKVALPAAITVRARELEQQARTAVAASARATPGNRSAAARGSDAWIEAQMTASTAGVALVPARGALTEIERLIADAGVAGQNVTSLESSRQTIVDLVVRQQARLDAVTPR